jgi:hypothetical protein
MGDVPAATTVTVTLVLTVVDLLAGCVVMEAATLRVIVALPMPATAGHPDASVTEVTV